MLLSTNCEKKKDISFVNTYYMHATFNTKSRQVSPLRINNTSGHPDQY